VLFLGCCPRFGPRNSIQLRLFVMSEAGHDKPVVIKRKAYLPGAVNFRFEKR